MVRPCLDCGQATQGSRCRICKTRRDRTNPYTTPTWRQLSLAVIERDGACVKGGSRAMLNAHHVIPRAEGGPDAPRDLEALCVVCHARASAVERGS